MFVWIALGAGSFLAGVRRYRKWRRVRHEERPLWLSEFRSYSELAAWVTGGAFLVLFPVNEGVLAGWGLTALVLCLMSLVLAMAVSRLMGGVTRAGVGSVHQFVALSTKAALRRLVAGWRRAVWIVMPTGWTEIRLRFATVERLLDPGFMVRSFLLVLLLAPVLLAGSVVWMMNSGTVVGQGILTALVGYNALAVLSCLTVAMLATVAAVTLLWYVRVLLVAPHIRAAFRVVAAGTGYGTAAGIVAAALLPIMSQGTPPTPVDGGTPVVLTPDVMVQLPAACAVVGFGIGGAVATLVICQRAENLFIRRVLAPALFIGATVVMHKMNLGPTGILQTITQPWADITVTDCRNAAFLNRLWQIWNPMETISGSV